VIEVGSWKGASAIHMARRLEDLGLGAEIVCVDTWLGAIEFLDNKEDLDRYVSLRLRHGYPTVYYQFLANVVKTGFQNVITPFPQTSLIAARWLRKHNVQAQLIYIDGSHEEEDVLSDLTHYWPVLAPDGIMFGDDFNEAWPGVRSAVRAFCELYGCELVVSDGRWVVRKGLEQGQLDGSLKQEIAARIATSMQFETISEQLQEYVLKTQTEMERLRVADQWFSGVVHSLTWRLLARFTIGRSTPPLGPEAQAPRARRE